MLRKISSFAVLTAIHLLVSYHTVAKAADQLTIGTDKPGDESHQLAVGLAALVKVAVLPNEDIDLDLADQNQPLDEKHLLIDRQSRLKTLFVVQPVDTFRSVMAFRSEDAADDLLLELIARADVPADAVYAVVKAIFENGPFLNTVSERAWDLSIDQTMSGLQLPIHSGAYRYFREIGGLERQLADLPQPDADVPSADQDGAEFDGERTFFIYFDGPHARLDPAAQDQVAAVCSYAAESRTPLMQISGPSGESPNGDANGLTDERLQSVLAALGQDTNCGPETSIVALDEPKSTLPAELLNAGDDRVDITIMVPAGHL